MTGLETTTFDDGDVVSVSCVVDRLYPRLDPSEFIMMWNSKVTLATESKNTDGTYKYKVEMVKAVDQHDDGANVFCEIIPAIGQAEKISKRLRVRCKYEVCVDPKAGYNSVA